MPPRSRMIKVVIIDEYAVPIFLGCFTILWNFNVPSLIQLSFSTRIEIFGLVSLSLQSVSHNLSHHFGALLSDFLPYIQFLKFIFILKQKEAKTT